jgi:hypothetical protein
LRVAESDHAAARRVGELVFGLIGNPGRKTEKFSTTGEAGSAKHHFAGAVAESAGFPAAAAGTLAPPVWSGLVSTLPWAVGLGVELRAAGQLHGRLNMLVLRVFFALDSPVRLGSQVNTSKLEQKSVDSTRSRSRVDCPPRPCCVGRKADSQLARDCWLASLASKTTIRSKPMN